MQRGYMSLATILLVVLTIMSTVLVLLASEVLSMRLDLEVLTNEVVLQRQQVESHAYDLASIGGETRSLATNVSLLNTQCEITLDMVVNASRGGWWNRDAAERLYQLANVRRLREENKWQRK